MGIKWLKMTAAALAVCTALCGLGGCSGGDEGEGTSEAGTAEADANKEPVAKVGYIFRDSVGDSGFSYDCDRQRIKALEYTDLDSEYIDNVSLTDFEKAVRMLAEDGCTHIVCGSPVYASSTPLVAKNYMNINFIDFGGTMRSVNIYAYTEQPYQATYIAGIAAAYNSESETIGFVCDPHMIYSTAAVNAAALGTQLVYTNAKLVLAEACRDAEIRKAVDALAKQGCDVIISYTESAETVRYCNEKGIKVIGNLDYTETASQYENMLMYYYSSRDSFYLSQFKAIGLESWEADAYVGTVGNSVIRVSDMLPAANEDTQAIVNKILPKVSTGSAYIFQDELKDTNNSVRQMQGYFMSTNDIYKMNWYVRGVDNESLESFVERQSNVEGAELVIKRTEINRKDPAKNPKPSGGQSGGTPAESGNAPSDADQEKLIQALGDAELTTDEFAEEMGLSRDEAAAMLKELEEAGVVKQVGDGVFKLTL